MKGLQIGKCWLDSSVLGQRDAIHVPILMAKLGYGVGAGDWVKIADGNVAEKVGRSHAIGMVDPFLDGAVPGHTAVVFIKPDLVEKVTHHFELPWDKDSKSNADKLADTVERLLEEIKELKSTVQDYEAEDDGCRGCY